VQRVLESTWQRVEGLDFSHGVVLEGELMAKRGAGGLAALFRWKGKHVVLSRHYRALFVWTGSGAAAGGAPKVDGPVTRLRLDSIEAVVHDAKAKSKTLVIRPRAGAGDPLEFMAASPEDAAAWSNAIRAVMVSLLEDDSKAALARQIVSDAPQGEGVDEAAGEAEDAAAAAAAERKRRRRLGLKKRAFSHTAVFRAQRPQPGPHRIRPRCCGLHGHSSCAR